MPQTQSADSKPRSESPSSSSQDIVGRLRTATGLDLDLKRGAADEIERLRSWMRIQDAVIRSGNVAALTEEEREALTRAVAEFRSVADEYGIEADERRAATLRGLLERLGGER